MVDQGFWWRRWWRELQNSILILSLVLIGKRVDVVAFLFLMIEDGVGGYSIFLGENDDIILMLLVCMYKTSVLIDKRVDVEKEVDLLYLDKDECLDGVVG